MKLLVLENVQVSYDDIPVVRNVSIEVDEGQIIGIVGPNGAGKTTLLKTIMGVLRPRSGRIIFKGRDITDLKPYERVKLGVCMVPEGRQLFNTLTVRENLILGGYTSGKNLKNRLEWVYKLFPVLEERSNQYAGTLSGGEQQMLAIARGLMAELKILLLDEPSLGLAPIIVEKLYETIRTINKEGISILLVEQHVDIVLKTADYVYVMGMGEIITHGKCQELASSEEIRRVYLG
ncbi:MAG: ABC transporter ATP-binding protein [Candidatus Caldarchaeales archaeon]